LQGVVLKGRPVFQFGLSSLLWAVTVVAILCSTAKTCPEGFWRIIAFAAAIIAAICVLVAAVDVFSWGKCAATDANTRGGKLKALFRSSCFWTAFCFTFLVVLSLNLIPYYRTHGAYRTDGVEVVGWPLDFWVCGGFSPTVRIDVLALLVDILAAMVLPAATGIAFRNGVRPFFRRGRIALWKLHRKARDWPSE
jgi:heme/copper-type cytochrome/quinol oxidase subunit 2